MGPKRSVSMKDVAALARVSVGTVSNVINTPQRVSEATARRVYEAVDALGWVPNESARQLRTGRSQAVGLVVLDVANPFFADVALGVEEVLYGHGYSVYIGNSDQQTAREERLLQQFGQQRVRGVLLAPIATVTEGAADLRRRGVPVVLVDRALGTDFCAVGVDDVEGGRLAVAHLIERGHRRIAFVGGPDSLAQVRDRRAGAQAALAGLGGAVASVSGRAAKAGHDAASASGGAANRGHDAASASGAQVFADGGRLLLIPTPALAIKPGVAAARQIAELPASERPTAVFAANDLLAIGLLQGLVAAGLRVPDDVALIGYDDIEFAASSAVPLSSVRQPRAELGERAAALLIEEIQAADEVRPHVHEVVRLTPVLVPRASTGNV